MNPQSHSSEQFLEELNRVRAGDPIAIQQFISNYESFIRRAIRLRIRRAALNVAADSVDVCQSVLGGFLIRLSAGEYELASEEDLRKLLFSIAKNKFLALQRRELADKRDRRQTVSLNEIEEVVDESLVSPDGELSHTELLLEFNARLSPDERHLYQQRRQGVSWKEISEVFGEDQAVLRKRLSRAIRRVSVELGLEAPDIP